MWRLIVKINYFASLVFVFLACSQPKSIASHISRFENLELRIGMNREEVEKQISLLFKKPMTYSPYNNNLEGGIVVYKNEGWILEVTYKSGLPAPIVINANGIGQGYPPIDETVSSYRIKRSKNK